jgi:hypothetical protein
MIVLAALLTAMVHGTNELAQQPESLPGNAEEATKETPRKPHVSYDDLEDDVVGSLSETQRPRQEAGLAPKTAPDLVRMQSEPHFSSLPPPQTRSRSTTDPHLREMARYQVFDDDDEDSDAYMEDDDDRTEASYDGLELDGGSDPSVLMEGKMQKRSKTLPRQWHWRFFVLSSDDSGGVPRLQYFRSHKHRKKKPIGTFDLSSPNCHAFVAAEQAKMLSRGGKKGCEVGLMCKLQKSGSSSDDPIGSITLRAPSPEDAQEWVAKIQQVIGSGAGGGRGEDAEAIAERESLYQLQLEVAAEKHEADWLAGAVHDLRTQALASEQASALAALAGLDASLTAGGGSLQALPPHFTAGWLGTLLQKERANGKQGYALGKVCKCMQFMAEHEVVADHTQPCKTTEHLMNTARGGYYYYR